MSAVSEEIGESIMENSGNMMSSGISEETSLKLRMLVAGGISGAASKTCTAPLARLTILYQVAGFGKSGEARPPRLGSALLQTVQREGVPALWKGNMATILHRLPYSAVAFWTFEESTSFLQKYFPKDTEAISGSTDVIRRFISGGLAGMAGTAVAYPLDLVRTRLAAQTTRMYYTGIYNAMKTIVREEGASGMYKGLGGSLLQVGPNLAINFCAYETLKSYWMSRQHDRSSPNIMGSMVCGGLSGLVSSTATFPIDLVRRRMQLEGQQGLARTYTGYLHIARDIFQRSGWRGFYSGIIPEYCKVMPGVAIVYTTFEFIKRNLKVDHYNAGQR